MWNILKKRKIDDLINTLADISCSKCKYISSCIKRNKNKKICKNYKEGDQFNFSDLKESLERTLGIPKDYLLTPSINVYNKDEGE